MGAGGRTKQDARVETVIFHGVKYAERGDNLLGSGDIARYGKADIYIDRSVKGVYQESRIPKL